jgi:hypothetical protein
MGLLVEVYRHNLGADCTNGGVSRQAMWLLVENINGPHSTVKDAPIVRLERHLHYSNYPIIRPVDADGRSIIGMFGGNFAYTSDSRFNSAVRKISGQEFGFPVAIHDRVETPSGDL